MSSMRSLADPGHSLPQFSNPLKKFISRYETKGAPQSTVTRIRQSNHTLQRMFVRVLLGNRVRSKILRHDEQSSSLMTVARFRHQRFGRANVTSPERSTPGESLPVEVDIEDIEGARGRKREGVKEKQEVGSSCVAEEVTKAPSNLMVVSASSSLPASAT